MGFKIQIKRGEMKIRKDMPGRPEMHACPIVGEAN